MYRYVLKAFAFIFRFTISLYHNSLWALVFLIFFTCNITITKNVSIIFKGQSVTFKKISSDRFEGQFNGKKVIAIPRSNKQKFKKSYLGAFRRLKRTPVNDSQKKLVTYYVYGDDRVRSSL